MESTEVMTSDERKKFRSSKIWKDFKTLIIKDRGLRCECCGRYTKTLTLHHKNMDKTHYTNISDKTHFSLLCLSCHSLVHHFHTQVNKKKATPNQMIIDFIKPFFVTQ